MLDKFFGGPTAFDYFLRGQEAKQNYDMNQQLMQARSQEMAQAELMNPLLLQAQRANIAQSKAATQSAIAGEQRAADLHPLSMQATQAEIDEFNAASKRAADLHPGEIDKQAALIEQARAAAASSRASTAASQAEAKAIQQQQASSARNQAILEGAQYIQEYEEMAKTNPEAAEQFKAQTLDQLGISEEDVNFDTIKAQARIINRMQPGEYVAVKGMPGVVLNKKTGTFNMSPEKMDQILQRKEKESGMFDSKTIRDVTNDLKSTAKTARESSAAAKKLLALGENASPTDQIAAMYSFIKSLDPGGVVTDREGGLLQTSEGAFQGIVNMYNQAVGEGGLKNLMPQIKQTAVTMANSQIQSTADEVGDILNVYQDNITKAQNDRLANLVPRPIELNPNAIKMGDTQADSDPAQVKQQSEMAIPGKGPRIKLTAEEAARL